MAGMFSAYDFEIRRVCGALRIDARQIARKVSVGAEETGDSFEDAEVGVIERIGTRQKRLTGVLGIEWAEMSAGLDLAGRLGVLHVNFVRDCLLGAHGLQGEFVNVKLQRRPAAGTIDFEDRSIGYYFSNCDLGVQRTVTVGNSMSEHRDLNMKSVQNKASDVMRPEQKVGVAAL